MPALLAAHQQGGTRAECDHVVNWTTEQKVGAAETVARSARPLDRVLVAAQYTRRLFTYPGGWRVGMIISSFFTCSVYYRHASAKYRSYTRRKHGAQAAAIAEAGELMMKPRRPAPWKPLCARARQARMYMAAQMRVRCLRRRASLPEYRDLSIQFRCTRTGLPNDAASAMDNGGGACRQCCRCESGTAMHRAPKPAPTTATWCLKSTTRSARSRASTARRPRSSLAARP